MALPIRYNIRNIQVRWQVTILAIVGIALVVTVFVFLTAMSQGFRIALRASGRTDNAIIVQKGSNSELTSGISRGNASLMMVDARIAPRRRRPAPGLAARSWWWPTSSASWTEATSTSRCAGSCPRP